MEPILELLRAIAQMLRSRYVRELEREIARLRAENRALLNSLLGTAGVPPLRTEDGNAESSRAASARSAQASSRAAKPVATPLHRRSWQQIGRMLEIEEARREREHAAQLAQIREKFAGDSATRQEGSGKPNGST